MARIFITFCSYCPGKSVVGYETDNNDEQSHRQSTATELGNFSIGSNFGWEFITTDSDRQFSIRADLTGELAETIA